MPHLFANTPCITDKLDNPTGLLASLNCHLAECELPDHYDEPDEYVEMVTYKDTIQDFVDLIQKLLSNDRLAKTAAPDKEGANGKIP